LACRQWKERVPPGREKISWPEYRLQYYQLVLTGCLYPDTDPKELSSFLEIIQHKKAIYLFSGLKNFPNIYIYIFIFVRVVLACLDPVPEYGTGSRTN
jgi:hypothetical protein